MEPAPRNPTAGDNALNDARGGIDGCGARGGDDENGGAERHERHRPKTGGLVPNLSIEPDERPREHRRPEAQKHVKMSERAHASS